VDVIGEAWSPAAELLEEGRAVMAAFGDVRAFRPRLTNAGLQLRLSRAGAGYRFLWGGGGWVLVAGPEADPARAFNATPTG